MLCSACCTERGEGRTGNTALFYPCCCLHRQQHCPCYPGTTLSIGCILHWMKHQGCKGPPCFLILKPLRELKKLFTLPERPKKKKCHFLDSSLQGGKALVLLLDSRPPVLLHAVNNQLHAMCTHCLGLILLQSHVLRLSSQVRLLPHLACHHCLSGRKFMASHDGPGAPSKLFLQWWWSWSTVPTQSGVRPSGSTDAVGQKGAPHGSKGPCSLSVGGTCLSHGTLMDLPDPQPYERRPPVVGRAAPLLLSPCRAGQSNVTNHGSW